MKLSNPEIRRLNNDINALRHTMAAENVKLDSMKVYDTTKIQADIDQLEGKLALHHEVIAKEKAAEKARLDKSKKLLDKTMLDLKKTADKLDASWTDIHHLHRGRLAEVKNILRQTLR